MDWLNLLYRFAIGKASTPLYYILVLIQLTLLTPILIKFINKNNVISKVMWLVTPLWFIFVYVYNIAVGAQPLLYNTLFPAWFLFYYMGLWIKIKRPQKAVYKFGKWYFVVGALALNIAESYLLLLIGCDITFAYSQTKFSNFIFDVLFILWLFNIEKKFKDKHCGILKAVGDCSYGIYFIHCFILIVVEYILRLSGIDSVWITYFLLTWILTALISFGIVWAANKLFNRWKYGRKLLLLVGFK